MKSWLVVVLSAILITIYIYPSAIRYSKDTLPDNNDTRLIAYIIGQVQDNIIHHQPLFYGRFFAPEKNTLAYSDLFLTTAIITLPAQLFTSNPIIIFNLAFIINSVLTICSAYLLFSYLFKDHWVSAITTLLLILSGFHLHYYPHMQLFSLWLTCLSIYFFLRFQKDNHPIFLSLFFLVLTAQIGESVFSAYLIFFSAFFLFITASKKDYKSIVLRSLPFLPFWALLVFPYLQFHFSFPEASRSIRDAANFSLGLEQIFTLFNSYTLIIIFISSFAFVIARSKATWQSRKNQILPWLYIFVFSLIMSLGPVVKLLGKTIKIFSLPIPLPYTLFYYLFPGFTGFRTPSRFSNIILLSMVIIIGYSLLPFINKLKIITKIVLTLIIFAFLIFEADLPLKGYPVNINMNPVYDQVKALPQSAIILELPVKLWNMPDHEIESIRSLYSLEHGHRRFGGFSGFDSNSWADLVQKIDANGLDKENLTKLHALGVTHVINNNQLFPLP